MPKIYVLGAGPGSAAYLPQVTAELAGQCDVLVGGKRNLALFDGRGREVIEITGHLDPVIAEIREKSVSKRVGVLVSGDTGIYSLLPRLAKEFGRENLAVYPGISPVQYFFARLGRCWHETRMVSLHGRSLDDLADLARGDDTVVVFTDPDNSPAAVCRRLVEAGVTGVRVFIGEDLSYPEEKISTGRPEDFINYRSSDLNLVIIEPNSRDGGGSSVRY